MADGLNDARAMRVAELMNDYRTLQLHISQHGTDIPSSSERSLEGYRVMIESVQAAQRLLSVGFSNTPSRNSGDDETQKAQLRHVIVDASARRFQAHKLYLRVAAARRWAIHRSTVLRAPRADDASRLREGDIMLQHELMEVTDHYVFSDLQSADMRAGYWLDEDPALSTILGRIGTFP